MHASSKARCNVTQSCAGPTPDRQGRLWGLQIQSNALAALEAIDADVADQVMRDGCVTGDRINGLCDGVTGEW